MNTKNFLISGLAAFVVNFLLGWLFYGILFQDLYPNQGEENMIFIALGCLFFGFVIAYVFTVVASIKSASEGFKVGAIFGLLNSLVMNFFMYATLEPNYQNIAIDVAISIVMVGIMGALVGVINGKMK
ncbi:MAG: hypothetical protein ABF260_01470 [Flavobacteriaceae bacterium]